jgi:glycosyltransferase involved in cell wall biosynthesis
MYRLALFLPGLEGGGAERIMLNLARGFVAQGLKVDLVLVRAEGPYLSQVPPQVRVVSLGNRRLLLSIPKLIRYMQQERPVAILCGEDDVNVVTLWVKRLTGVSTRVIVSVHNTLSRAAKNTSRLKTRLAPYLARWFYPWADGIVAVSQGVAKDLAHLGLPSECIQVIYNPVVTPELLEKIQAPLDRAWFSPNQPPVILGVGRLEKQKDFPTLIRAFAQLQQQIPARLMILGEGSERPDLETLVKELKLTEVVALPGFIANPYAYMARAAVCVLSSRWEGLPTVIIEAMAGGTPVVSTNCESGPAEILANGQYGKLVAVGDIEGMAEAIASTLREPQDTNLVRQRAMEFSLERAVAQYKKVLLVD